MSIIERSWQSRGPLACLLWPVSLVFRAILWCRRLAFTAGIIKVETVSLPVVVVGNLSVGGTGKTPLCAYLVSHFKKMGWRPAVVSRGYGGNRHEQPYLVGDQDSANDVGDEPLMLHQQTGVPVCVCIHRAAAVRHISEHCNADIVFSDDGLQHWKMPRVAEIVVIDSARGLGNRWLLPAGPLRDLPSVLKNVDLLVFQKSTIGDEVDSTAAVLSPSAVHSSLLPAAMKFSLGPSLQHSFCLQLTHAVNIVSGERVELAHLVSKGVHAVAGIGNPERFFASLRAIGFSINPHPMPDHHVYTLGDITFDDNLPVLVTAKDAVKLRSFSKMPVSVYEVCTCVVPSAELEKQIENLEKSMQSHRSS
ncbi:MAG: tetraacyldisaccharide 4'-kinase [Granulosicoccus sp.]